MPCLGVEPISSLFRAYIEPMSSLCRVYVYFINNNDNKI